MSAPREDTAMNRIVSGMQGELHEAAAVVERQAHTLAAPLAALIKRLRARPPDVVVTCARGSSAHAATFAKHLVERHLGLPVAAAAPNIASLYRRPLRLKDQLFLAISQSGRSDDLIETAAMARRAGALTVAIVNDRGSPLAQESEIVLPLDAGPELSVAATKSFVASLAALLRFTAAWTKDAAMDSALMRSAGSPKQGPAARLERSAGTVDGYRKPRDHRPRPDAGDRSRSGFEAEGNLCASCRGFQRRRIPSRAGRASVQRLSDYDLSSRR